MLGLFVKSALLISVLTAPVFAQKWDAINLPENPRALEIQGSYSHGCIAGAQALSQVGSGYQLMRTSRNRFYGTPELIQFAQKLGRFADSHQHTVLLGDLSQPRGGPMPSGHASHQTGLDMDVWLANIDALGVSLAQTENLSMQTVVDKVKGRLNTRWHPIYAQYLQYSAEQPEVARIFVNPVIKAHLCEITPNAKWLAKLRPWWNHDAHFHVRLHCPPQQLFCESQTPLSSDNGCVADLAQWITDQSHAATNPVKPVPRSKVQSKPPLPEACDKLLRLP